MKRKKHRTLSFVGGVAVGILNGIFGAGGGALMVPLLEKQGLSPKESHAGAIGVILPVSLLSAILYLWQGNMALADAYPFLPGTILGSVAGALFLKKITSRWLKGLFGAFLIFAGVRMVMG